MDIFMLLPVESSHRRRDRQAEGEFMTSHEATARRLAKCNCLADEGHMNSCPALLVPRITAALDAAVVEGLEIALHIAENDTQPRAAIAAEITKRKEPA
jgi:hypothetical protein